MKFYTQGFSFTAIQLLVTGLFFLFPYFLSHLFSPDVLSQYVLIHATANGAFAIFNFGMNQALIFFKRYVNVIEYMYRLLSSLTIVVFFALVVITAFFNQFVYISVYILFTLFNILNVFLLSKDKYLTYGLKRLSWIFALYLGCYIGKLIGLDSIVFVYLFALLLLINLSTTFRFDSRYKIILKKFWAYSKHAYVSNIVTFFAYKLPVYLVIFFYGRDSQAHFALALSASETIFILANIINTYLFSFYSNRNNINNVSLNQLRQLKWIYMLFSCIILVLIYPLLSHLVGPQFDLSYIREMFIIISIGNLFFINVKFNNTAFLLLDSTKTILLLSIVNMVLVNTAYFIGGLFESLSVSLMLASLGLIIIAIISDLFLRNERNKLSCKYK